MLTNILKKYNLQSATIKPFGNGLINQTWLVELNKNKYILQKINQVVFKKPVDIAENINLISEYLSKHFSNYLFVAPKQTIEQKDMAYIDGDGYYRLFPFIQNSYTVDVVSSPQQAYEAAKQFGRFTKLLGNFSVKKLNITLPDFHNLSLRYQQFLNAIEQGNKKKIAQSSSLIKYLISQNHIVIEYENICNNPSLIKRVTHHDTKISNVLFDKNNNGLCVIDLDTMMPGYFISDVGDMMRTYLCPFNEDENDFTKIEIRDDFFKALHDGYLSEMKDELSSIEKKYFFYSGKYIIYMQAIRFLTDYFYNDIYYGKKYDEHNFVRAGNQITLLKKLISKEKKLSRLNL